MSELDPGAGKTRVERFTAIHDFGNIGNPMTVCGQAMRERCVYDTDSGQLLTGTYMDHTMPRADDLPNLTADRSWRAARKNA